MNYTISQLQAALVRALPEKLRNDPNFIDGGDDIRWRKTMAPVTPHEWPAIVGMVEDGLTHEKHKLFRAALWNRSSESHNDYLGFDGLTNRAYCSAKCSVRAAALADIGAITVEEAK